MELEGCDGHKETTDQALLALTCVELVLSWFLFKILTSL